MYSSREKVRVLIKLSSTIEEVDEVINKNYGFETVGEKIAFLKGMFDIDVIGHDKDKTESTYFAMLNAILYSWFLLAKKGKTGFFLVLPFFI